jgi:hypothetical protein
MIESACRRGLQALALMASALLPMGGAMATVPIDGTHSVTFFCGTIYESTKGMTNHGLDIGQPYVGNFDLYQESPQNPEAGTTQWACELNTYGCGTFHLVLPGFVPPQLEHLNNPPESDIHGPVESIHQSVVTYRLVANVDNWIADAGPAYLGAVGDVSATILCSGCPDVNDKLSIRPDFRDAFADVNGDLALQMTIPGVGGSLAPPEGNLQEVNGFITRLGGACNNILPASSSWGLVGLVGLMVATTVFFAGRKGASGG